MSQAFYNKESGTKALTTETGAGQWGSALAMACNFFDLDLEVYMVKVSYHQKPYRRIIMENFGAQVYASPSDHTHYGQSVLAQDPNSPGSLGIATPALATASIAGASVSEAVEAAASSGGAKKYSLGSVLGHVLLHQTVVGQEALEQTPALAFRCKCGDGRRAPRLRHRVRGWWLEFRRLRLPLLAPEPDGGQDQQGPHLRFGQVSSLSSRHPARA